MISESTIPLYPAIRFLENAVATQTAPLPATPNNSLIPLPAALRAAYTSLYHQYEIAIENTTDPGALEALNASQNNVDDTLTLDNMCRLKAITTLYAALAQQMKSTNDELKAVKTQILAISSGISTFGDVLGAIDKVLSLLPGI
jgi:hypothetical protein